MKSARGQAFDDELGHAPCVSAPPGGPRSARPGKSREGPGQGLRCMRACAKATAAPRARSLCGQGWHELGAQFGQYDDVADVEAREHEPGQEGAGVELHHDTPATAP